MLYPLSLHRSIFHLTKKVKVDALDTLDTLLPNSIALCAMFVYVFKSFKYLLVRKQHWQLFLKLLQDACKSKVQVPAKERAHLCWVGSPTKSMLLLRTTLIIGNFFQQWHPKSIRTNSCPWQLRHNHFTQGTVFIFRLLFVQDWSSWRQMLRKSPIWFCCSLTAKSFTDTILITIKCH